ncbi:hypothetical protein AB4865_04835 [Capnocytophaga sp. ARDL2]|uniref:hypothetical protein n=1 Tax=Capnocytophaga sp. ARDL2 TaxID=3238809 RepID=UPI0035568208
MKYFLNNWFSTDTFDTLCEFSRKLHGLSLFLFFLQQKNRDAMLLEETETFAYKITYVVYVSIGLKKLSLIKNFSEVDTGRIVFYNGETEISLNHMGHNRNIKITVYK